MYTHILTANVWNMLLASDHWILLPISPFICRNFVVIIIDYEVDIFSSSEQFAISKENKDCGFQDTMLRKRIIVKLQTQFRLCEMKKVFF